MKLIDISGTNRENILMTKLMSLKHIAGKSALDTYIGEYINSIRRTTPEIIKGGLCADSHNICNRQKNVEITNADPYAYSHNICDRRKNYFLNVCRIIDVNQIKIHKADPLVPELSPLKVEITIEK
jgi:hypothetical protein